MREMTQTDSELFDGGPPLRLERSVGLITPDNPRIIHRAILSGIIGWVPLVVLAVAQDSSWGGERIRSLLSDLAVAARFLIAAPLFIVAESICIPQLNQTTGDWHRSAHAARSRVVRPLSPVARSVCAQSNDSGDSPD